MKKEKKEEVCWKVSGNLCIDFINTLEWRRDKLKKIEGLPDFSAVIQWSKYCKIIDNNHAQSIIKKALLEPLLAKKAYHKAIGLRELLYNIFSSMARTGKVSPSDLALFNQFLSDSLGKLWSVIPYERGFVWSFNLEKDSLDFFLGPILKSAADLLVSPELNRVKQCANNNCGWLFIDKSRNRSRRWCSMKSCGNRAKAHRHYLSRKSRKD